MPLPELITRGIAGYSEDGSPRYRNIRHFRPRPPETVAEWVQVRAETLAGLPAGSVVVRVLLADGDAAVKAAVAAGRDVPEIQRWSVLQCLEKLREMARADFPAAAGRMDELIAAWTAKHGSKPPQPPRIRTA